MKRIFAVLLMVVFCGFVLTGCGESSIVGTWKTEEVLVDGDYEYTETVTFNEDNTGVITYKWANKEETESWPLTWTRSEGDDEYLVTIDNGSNYRNNFMIEVKNGKFTAFKGMTREISDEKDIVYVKQ